MKIVDSFNLWLHISKFLGPARSFWSFINPLIDFNSKFKDETFSWGLSTGELPYSRSDKAVKAVIKASILRLSSEFVKCAFRQVGKISSAVSSFCSASDTASNAALGLHWHGMERPG